MSVEHLVVVGASLAGLRAVEAARKAGFPGRITLVGAEEHLPYDRPPLSKAFQHLDDDGAEADPPFFRSEAELRDELDVELLLGRPATALDTDRRVVTVGHGDDSDEVPYDALVVATGATPRTLPGTEGLAGVHCLRTLDDALAIREAIGRGGRTVVIGAGFIGSEIASSAARRGVEVTVVEAQETPLLRAAGAAMGPAVAALHARRGTRLLTGVGVASVEGSGGRVERVVLDDGAELPADLVVVGMGVRPATDWLEGSGLTLEDGVVCDETLWTGVDGVWAAGDVARWPNPHPRRAADALGELDRRRRDGRRRGPQRARPGRRHGVRDRALLLVGLVRRPHPVRGRPRRRRGPGRRRRPRGGGALDGALPPRRPPHRRADGAGADGDHEVPRAHHAGRQLGRRPRARREAAGDQRAEGRRPAGRGPEPHRTGSSSSREVIATVSATAAR